MSIFFDLLLLHMDLTLVLISFFSSIAFIIITQRFFLEKKYTDSINIRSSHNTIATRSGGIAIFLTIFLISCFFYVTGYDIYDFSLLIPLSLLMLVGFYDDINGIDFKLKFIFQIIAAKIIIDNGLIIDNLHGVLGIFELNRILAQTLTIFIILAIINAINFIDGIDGLAITIIIWFIFLFEFFANSISPYTNLTQIIIPALIPLYYFNFRKKNKIFLGDSGSLFLGGIVSIYVIYVLNNEYLIKPEFDLHKVIFVLSILFYPIIDLIRIFFFRLLKGKSPFQPDKNHIHHAINNKFDNHLKTVFLIFMSSVIALIIIQIIA